MKEIRKIVVTGGPCGGKSTAMKWIREAFSVRGWTVLFIPETATELISGGVAPWTCGTNLDYQRCQVQLQLEKERIFRQAALTMPGERFLLVCDRGIMDNLAYMSREKFSAILDEQGRTEAEMLAEYDAVFHLVTAARGKEEFYTLANNAARTETPAQAIVLDDRAMDAWNGHPRHRIIDNSTDFDRKMGRLVEEIADALGLTAAV